MSRGALQLEEARSSFEGKEEYEVVRHRLHKKMSGRATPKESQRFLQLMRDRGGGNIALAWRRYFDSDGDGTLSFREFCAALIELKYKGDVPALWIELGGSITGELTLEALDPDNAAILDYFGDWCCRPCFGGPLEVFKLIDDDGSDSLTPEEFADGLRELKFFDDENLLPSLADEDAVQANLFPLLDQGGTGCVAPGQMVFLEKDAEKKKQLCKMIERIAKYGAQAAPEPLHNDAQRMLHTLAMSTTMLGGKEWKLHGSEMACGVSRSAQRRLFGSRSSSSLRPRTSPSSPSSTKSTQSLPKIGGETQLTLTQEAGNAIISPTKNVDRVAWIG